MKKFLFSAVLLTATVAMSAQKLNKIVSKTKETAKAVTSSTATSTGTTSPTLSNDEVIKGLKEALTVGTNNSTNLASKLDGFYKNPKIFIPMPPEATTMKERLVKMGMEKQVNEFEESLNRAAEEAAVKAAPVFVDAVKNMSIADGFAILKGSDTAATHYMRVNTNAALTAQFMPIVKEAIAKVKVTNYWTPLATAYNKIPGVKKQNPDLDAYVTNKAIDGLMTLLKDEEAKIRANPAAQVTDLLKKVFGSLTTK